MRVAIVNDVWDPRAPTAEATLARFTTLTGWAHAIRAAGADVAVFQRFHTAAQIDSSTCSKHGCFEHERSKHGCFEHERSKHECFEHQVRYEFVADGGPARPTRWFGGSRALHAAVAAWAPDVVHVNGMDYPRAIRRLARTVVRPIAVQDHGGFDPAALSLPRRIWLRWGLDAAAALLVATPPQADAIRATGLAPRALPVRDVMEGSTALRADPDRPARTPLALLSVGRLNPNKDPLTVLRGFERFAATHDATLTFVYQDATLERELGAAIEASAMLRGRVTLAGEASRDRLPAIYEGADLFVLGSHHEGSGYAALEAMACGVVPVLTAIPPFRWLTDEGRAGDLWTVGDPESLGAALDRVAAQPLPPQRRAVRDRFDRECSWDAIGRRALAIYRELCRT